MKLAITEVPQTLGGWLAAISVVSAVLLAWGGIVIKLARAHIDRRIDQMLDKCVKDAVKVAIAPLERQINNGLTSTVNAIDERQRKVLAQLSEMHGWMQATHGRKPGEERRKELP